jgi:ATP-binding cassette subfamily B protein
MVSNLLHTGLLLMFFLVYSRRMSIGEYISLFVYSFFVFGPLHEVSNVISVYREAEASLEKMQEIMNLPEEHPRSGYLVALRTVSSVECDNVSYLIGWGEATARHSKGACPSFQAYDF